MMGNNMLVAMVVAEVVVLRLLWWILLMRMMKVWENVIVMVNIDYYDVVWRSTGMLSRECRCHELDCCCRCINVINPLLLYEVLCLIMV